MGECAAEASRESYFSAYSLVCSAHDVTSQSQSSLSTQPTENRMLGIAIRLLAVFFICIMAACVKLAGDEGVHVVESLFWRQLAGLPVVIILLHWQGSLRDIHTNRRWSHAARMILGLSGMALNYTAMTMLPLAESTTIGLPSRFLAPFWRQLSCASRPAIGVGRQW